MTTEPTPDRRGFALPVAVFALVVVGVLVTGGFYMARQETRIGIASEKGTAAFYLAERGVSDVMENWNAPRFGALLPQETDVVVDTVDGQGFYRVEVTKVSDWIYMLDSRGVITDGGPMMNGATRRVATLAKIRTIDMRPPAALTTVGGLTVGGSSQVFGQDSIPGAWGSDYCDPERLADAPGVMIDDASEVSFSGSNHELDGNPPVAEDPTLTSDDLLTYGDLTWTELVSMATNILPGGLTISDTDPDSVQVGGTWYCNTSLVYNWGHPYQPRSACGNHFPVIYIQGDARIQSGDFGQGILLVDGDLQLNGGYTFFGPVVVRGTVSTAGTGGHFFGGLIAANVELSTTTVLGDALVQFSSCAVTRALLNNAALAIASPLPERSWVDLSNLAN
ncbi:MAG TPA: hypothetical protein VK858_07360 [Longimicrobiales bacterium]|nr:hypothetical protein [Longimicrobiales bacterium]